MQGHPADSQHAKIVNKGEATTASTQILVAPPSSNKRKLTQSGYVPDNHYFCPASVEPVLVFLEINASQMSLENIQSELKLATYYRDTPEAFIPYESVQQIWAGDRLERFLKTHDPSWSTSEIDAVRDGLLRTISILASIALQDWSGWSRLREIFFLQDDAVADRRRDKNTLVLSKEELQDNSFLGNALLVRAFMDDRWIYFPIVLKGNKQDPYGEDLRLPLFQEDHPVRHGGFGKVTKEMIPPKQIILGHLSDQLGIPEAPHSVKLIVARKRFPKGNYDVEVRHLNHLRSSLSAHKRIISDLAIFTIRNELNIIMPWADMDLEDFLVGGYKEMQPTPCLTDLIQESRKVASAIDFLHTHLQLESEWPEFHHQAICHADLKPRNILVFKRDGSSTGIWRITDFGVSRIAHRDIPGASGYSTSINNHAPRGGAYRAPEAQSQRRSDVWSFGCILVRVFALGLDPASLPELDKMRKGPPNARVYDDCFYRGSPPALNSAVEAWIKNLPVRYPVFHSPVFFEEMQRLLRSMLEIDYHSRSSASEVQSGLHRLNSSTITNFTPRSSVSRPSSKGVGVLVAVIKTGNINHIREILQDEVDVEQCYEGDRPLIYAIDMGNAAIIINELSEYQRKFHDRNLDVRTPSSKRKTPLYLAVCKGDVEIVKAVIDAYIDPDSHANTSALLNELCEDKTPLMQASFLGHADVVSLLLQRGADHRICVQEEKFNCLHYAVKTKNRAQEDVIRAFKDIMVFDQLPPGDPYDSSENIPSTTAYETPMMLHIKLALAGMEVDSVWKRKFKALLEGGANVNMKYGPGIYNQTSLLELAVSDGNLLIVELLLSAGATLPTGYVIPGRSSRPLRKLLNDTRAEFPQRRFF
ncbi:hypothetical protein PENCOP_c017G04971 [Penicillium coprophilum]|uniref:Protein kinase domain-containing protein n=1 Tax=Penicillium coprophilum TaxID=36646 RepID=A0A1V6U7W4_9EURO|nr:hypothetical protein PENCOP_c017G04971 [Penicillium coprophilum]